MGIGEIEDLGEQTIAGGDCEFEEKIEALHCGNRGDVFHLGFIVKTWRLNAPEIITTHWRSDASSRIFIQGNRLNRGRH